MNIPPVIKDLAPQNMPPNAPNTLVSFRRKPLMPQILRIEIVHLEAGMMNMRSLVRAHEKGMVINIVLAAVDMAEDGHFLGVFRPRTARPSAHLRVLGTGLVDVQNVRRHQVEMPRVEVELCGEVLHAEPVVSQLVDGSWTGLEALELALARGIQHIVDNQLCRKLSHCCWFLAMDQIDWEAFWIGEADHVSAARSVLELFNGSGVE